MNERAKLTEPYPVFLVVDNVDVTVPAGAEFELLGKVRNRFIGIYTHPKYGEVTITTLHAEKVEL